MQPRRCGLQGQRSQSPLDCHFIDMAQAFYGGIRHVGKYIDAVSLNPLHQAWRACADALPGQCAVCFSWCRGRLCTQCLIRFAAPTCRCRRCALRVPEGVAVCGACIKSPPPFDSALASVDYGHPWDQLIARFKFNAALDLSRAFADLMVRTHAVGGQALPDWVLPVPLSGPRLRERGYNQAWELARRAGRRLQVPTDARLLLRVKDTPHQLALPPARRAANVRGAFAVEPTRLHELRGKRVAVIDDVMTTAATANEVAAVLRQAGAAEVHFWVIARTPRPGE
jgi:ComF family protein